MYSFLTLTQENQNNFKYNPVEPPTTDSFSTRSLYQRKLRPYQPRQCNMAKLVNGKLSDESIQSDPKLSNSAVTLNTTSRKCSLFTSCFVEDEEKNISFSKGLIINSAPKETDLDILMNATVFALDETLLNNTISSPLASFIDDYSIQMCKNTQKINFLIKTKSLMTLEMMTEVFSSGTKVLEYYETAKGKSGSKFMYEADHHPLEEYLRSVWSISENNSNSFPSIYIRMNIKAKKEDFVEGFTFDCILKPDVEENGAGYINLIPIGKYY